MDAQEGFQTGTLKYSQSCRSRAKAIQEAGLTSPRRCGNRSAMNTIQRVHFGDSRHMGEVPDGSAALVVTSPPYPMIEMWDPGFTALNPAVGAALARADGKRAFDLMHAELDPVWREVHRILMPGGFACVNVGDAARTLDGTFMLYPNHARILSALLELGFTPLPSIL